MSALSKDLSAEQTTVDGLDNFFESVNADVMTVTSDTESALDVTADRIFSWTLHEAAVNLRLSPRTILRRLKSGSLRGHKILGANGPEWRIQPVDLEPVTE